MSPETTTTRDTAHWRQRLTELLDTYQVPGASLGILRDGGISEVSAGVLSTTTRAPVDPDSVWQIGSITKVWTATLIMQLRDEGKLDLDQPVVELLPGFVTADPQASAQVTVRQLLNHTSGIDGDVFTDTGRGDDCLTKYLDLMGEVKQNHPVGATWSYCNSGYSVLGAIIEKLTEGTWDAALHERICARLGLQATVTLPEETLLHSAAVGHIGPPGSAPRPTPQMLLPRSCGPAGLITSRVHDLLVFARAHLAGGQAPGQERLLSEESTREMASWQVDVPDPYSLGGGSWGLGWIRFDWDGHELIGHDGSTLGQNAFMRILPDQGFAVALFTNGGRARELYQELFTEIFAELAEVQMPPAFEPPEQRPSLDLDPWLGEYERASVRTEVYRADDVEKIRLTMLGPMAELDPEHAVQELELVPVAEGLYGAYTKETGTYTPVTFYQIEDGTRYLHLGVRANPKTTGGASAQEQVQEPS